MGFVYFRAQGELLVALALLGGSVAACWALKPSSRSPDKRITVGASHNSTILNSTRYKALIYYSIIVYSEIVIRVKSIAVKATLKCRGK